ncbi:MAG: hypothetical protein ABIA21_01295, partial [Candidatus Aenigmatarchaeota archaeon]
MMSTISYGERSGIRILDISEMTSAKLPECYPNGIGPETNVTVCCGRIGSGEFSRAEILIPGPGGTTEKIYKIKRNDDNQLY